MMPAFSIMNFLLAQSHPLLFQDSFKLLHKLIAEVP